MSFGPTIQDKDIFLETGFEFHSTVGRFDYYEHKTKFLRAGVSLDDNKLWIESTSPIKKHFKSGKRKTGNIVPEHYADNEENVKRVAKEILNSL